MKSLILTLVYSLGKFAHALNPVLVKGNVFYDSVTKERVFLIGVDYQPLGEQGIDPLVDPDVCARDLFLMQQLGINTMRVYTVDATKNHDECMSMYNAGGIYVLLDVNAGHPGHYLNRDTPWITYNSEYATNVFTTMTVFSGYSNVIGFFTGNELINAKVSATTSPPYVKAITRDMKAYIGKHFDRPLPIGYSAADNIDYRTETATYMSCGTAEDGVNDFYAMNNYQACGKQTIHTSGYDALIEQFKDFKIPLFFSEIGCNQVKRTFTETEFVFGPEMTPKFSGCLVYEWSQEANNYGLVEISPSGDVKIMRDYDVLQSQYDKISNLPKDIPQEEAKPVPCPSSSQFVHINGSDTLPRLDEIDAVIQKGVSAKPGKLSDIELVPTKYKIVDSKGNEITAKTPKKVSGVSKVDLSAKVKEVDSVPDAPKKAGASSSSAAGVSGDKTASAGLSSGSVSTSDAIKQNAVVVLVATIAVALAFI